jgi:hypothetical protein
MDNKLILILLIIAGFIIFMNYSNKSESLDNVAYTTATNAPVAVVAETKPVIAQSMPVVAEPQHAMTSEPANTANTSYADVSYKPVDIADKIVSGSTQLKAEDLLPKYDEATDFSKENPVSNLLKEQNFLISGYHMGINTVLQSNKIPYHDLRSAPVIPKQEIGPWGQSSYENFAGSAARRHFELGP